MKPSIVNGLLNLMQKSTVSLFQHSINVTNLALRIYISICPQKTDIETIILGALLHDVGKIFIKKEIINKPGSLTKSEWQEIKRHPFLGSAYVAKKGSGDTAVTKIICYHHERWDGKGYLGLKGEEIPLFARIVTIADALDAMISPRSYRLSLSLHEAFGEINRGSGAQFDPHLIASLGQESFWQAVTYCNPIKIKKQIIKEKQWLYQLHDLPCAFVHLLVYAQNQWMNRLYEAAQQLEYKSGKAGYRL